MDVKAIKMRARLSEGRAAVKCLMPHPMETGIRKGIDGKPIPAHYIETVTCTHNGETVLTADWGPSVSRDPYFAFAVRNAAVGDVIAVSWRDNLGNSASGEVELAQR